MDRESMMLVRALTFEAIGAAQGIAQGVAQVAQEKQGA
jgi:hypothetical protein